MRILHILDHSIPLQSGYTFRTRNILLYQRKLGWETFHMTGVKQGGGLELEQDVDELHFFRTPARSSICQRVPVLNQLYVINTLAQRLAQVVEQVHPDILHAHSPALNGIAAQRVARKYGLPLVYECRAFWEDAAVDHGTNTEWGLRYRLSRALESRVFNSADAVTTICEGLRNDIVARGNNRQKVTVIPNAVDLNNFSLDEAPDEALAKSLNLQGKTVLGFIGSFYAYEGIPLLLEALPEILEKMPDVKLLLVGGGPDEEQIRQRVEALGLSDSVVLTGRVSHNDVQRYYSLVDIFVYPRLPMRLTDLVTPLKPLEAMAQGRLVVASDVGGHKELIKSGHNGYLFRANDAKDLARTLDLLLSQGRLWDKLTAAGREYVETERNWQKSVGRYQAVYGALL